MQGLKSVEPDILTNTYKDGRGDVDKVTPNQPINAAKQHMEQDRGQTFTSASGKPTFT